MNNIRFFVLIVMLCLYAISGGVVLAVTGTLTIKGTQSATGVMTFENGIFLGASEHGVKGIRIISKLANNESLSSNQQEFENYWLSYYDENPDIASSFVDSSGSPCVYAVWGDTTGSTIHFPDSAYFTICQEADLRLKMTLDGLADGTPFPNSDYPDSVNIFLEPTEDVQSDNAAIFNYARTHFISGCTYQFQVVANVFKWTAQNLQWRSPSSSSVHVDALGILSDTLEPNPQDRYRTHCVGFAHLPIAFLRALGIPARYVSGTTFTAGDAIPTRIGWTILLWGSGAHAWVEVYYQDEGWVPYDGQAFIHHIDAIRLKKAHGRDYRDRHTELEKVQVYTPYFTDWVSMGPANYDYSRLLNCSGNICSTDSLQFLSHDPSWPSVRLVVADSARAISECCNVAGDANGDSFANVGDAVYIINYVFKGGPPPPCEAEADPNDDCLINTGDAVFIINYVFKSGPAPVCSSCR